MYFFYLRDTNYNNLIISLSSLNILYHSTCFNKVDHDKADHNDHIEDKDKHNKENLNKDTHNKVDHNGDKQNKDNSKDIKNIFFFLLRSTALNCSMYDHLTALHWNTVDLKGFPIKIFTFDHNTVIFFLNLSLFTKTALKHIRQNSTALKYSKQCSTALP